MVSPLFFCSVFLGLQVRYVRCLEARDVRCLEVRVVRCPPTGVFITTYVETLFLPPLLSNVMAELYYPTSPRRVALPCCFEWRVFKGVL